MKILHTGDWHMNDVLGRVDRTEDIFRSIEKIASYLDEHAVDVLLVAGDLFSERSRPEQTRAAIERLNRLFEPFLRRGGTMVAIPGNHDSEVFFDTLRNALALVAPAGARVEGANSNGSLYLSARGRLITLAAPREGDTKLQIAMLPYPTARAYLENARSSYATIEDKHRAIQDAFTKTLQQMRATVDASLPSILLSHVHVRGVQTHTLYRVSEVEDVVFDPSDIPTNWAYVAYGHIHKPQEAIAGAKHVRYCGSVERLDFAERADEKSCVLFEVDASGLVGEIELLPLPSSTLLRVEIENPQRDIPKLKEKFPEHETALVQYALHWLPGRDNRDDLARHVQDIFPRWYAREFVQLDAGKGKKQAREVIDLRDVTGTVRAFLQEQLQDDPRREAVLELAESYLAQRGGEAGAANAALSAPSPETEAEPEPGKVNSQVLEKAGALLKFDTPIHK
jgi:exonuclease SbcD